MCANCNRHLLALVVGLLAIGGCSQPAAVSPAPGSSASPPAIAAGTHPKRKALVQVVEQPGTLRAYEETQLYARVPGYVRLKYDSEGKLVTDIGRKVKGPRYDASGKETEPGEILAELDVPDLEQEASQKRALVAQAEAETEQAQQVLAAAVANIAVVEATVTEAKALYDRWESESNRIAGLAKQGVIDAQSRDETKHQFRAAEGRLESARAAVLKAKADRDKAQADVKAARARVEVARAELRRLETLLGFARIPAPFDGVVTRRRVSNGDFVQPAGKGDWLFAVARINPIRAVVAVPEADAPLVREGAEAKLSIQVLGGAERTGPVARTSWDLETGSRTLRTEIDLPNKDGTLRPGMFVSARVNCRLPEAWVLPATAVIRQGDTMVCFLVEDGKAVRVPVQVGRGDGKEIQVFKYQKPGTPPVWTEWTETDRVAAQAVGLSDGQPTQEDAGKK
jgi:multidrug efflux pump subunit AcrA (membrane-fusion protein)